VISGSRILAMAYKEVLHIRRDPTTLALALVVPVALILLFGFAISFDLDALPIAVVDHAESSASRELVRGLTASGELVVEAYARNVEDALVGVRRGDLLAVLVVPPDYEAGTTVQLLVDGSDGTTATNLLGKADAIGAVLAGTRPETALSLVSVFNPAMISAWFIVPGLAAYVVAIVCVLLTALTVAREIERGSMEQLFATPVHRLEVLLGKLLPYLGLGCTAVLLVVVVGMTVFDVPFRGDPCAFAAASFLFVAGMLGQGLLVSTIARSQMVATQVATMSSVLPSMLLSGFMFPIENMPPPLQALSTIVPARYYVSALRGVLLRGNGFDPILPELGALAAFAFLTLAIATARFRREA